MRGAAVVVEQAALAVFPQCTCLTSRSLLAVVPVSTALPPAASSPLPAAPRPTSPTGISLHSPGFVPYCATFFIFSDYMRNPMRMAALSEVRPGRAGHAV